MNNSVPEDVLKRWKQVYVCRDVSDSSVIVSFGLCDGTLDELREIQNSVGRRGVFSDEGVWEELERWNATTAFVRFSGGGGSLGSIGAVTLENGENSVLARWGVGERELPEALAAPIWGRYALFRGHPRIRGLLIWDVKERCVLVAGERGGDKFDQVLVSKLVTGTRQASLRETAKQSERQPCA